MRRLLFFALIILAFQADNGDCAEKYLNFGIGRIDGDTKYSIGGKYFSPDSGVGEYPFPISVLEFDIELYMASLGAGIKFAYNWEIAAEIRKNISSGSGVLKDSDYLSEKYSGIPDIYSESHVDLDALSAELNIQYRLIEGIYAGIGYLYQNFDYDIKDFRQWYPLGNMTDETGGTYGPGLGLTYDVKYHIPYLKIGAKGNISDEMQIETSLRYAPRVWAKDKDNHIERGLYSEGDCEGTAWFWALIARYDFPNRWFMIFEFDYSRIETDGDSKTYSEGLWSNTIYDEIESTQTYFSLTAGYRF